MEGFRSDNYEVGDSFGVPPGGVDAVTPSVQGGPTGPIQRNGVDLPPIDNNMASLGDSHSCEVPGVDCVHGPHNEADYHGSVTPEPPSPPEQA